MYLDDIASVIRTHIPEDRLPTEDVDSLLRMYAVLLQAKGSEVTQRDVHDVWSAWMSIRNDEHESLLPYEDLDHEVREQDRIFATAIRKAAEQIKRTSPSCPEFAEVLFPAGPPEDQAARQEMFELYKIMVESSESLVSRRQGVNTFFLTMNGALLAASGVIVQSAGDARLASLGILVLATAGALLCLAWRSLINSFGQLNGGKFRVINAIERYFSVAIYAAEWEALARGRDPRIYRSFTSREIWVPNALFALHVITFVAAILIATGCIPIGTSPGGAS